MSTENGRIKLSDILPNPNNPRNITEGQYEKLKKSIREFPQMLELRPIVIDENNMVLGGNMRLKVLVDLEDELNLEMVPFTKITNLTDEQKQEFIIKDNVSYGEWDWEQLTTDWDTELLTDWGMDILEWEESEVTEGTDDDEGSIYSQKIKAPIYEPSEEQPDFWECYDTRKFDKLKRDIDNSNLSDTEKQFLTYAASRHIQFMSAAKDSRRENSFGRSLRSPVSE